MAGIGTFGYEPNVNYLFGFPKSIKPGGVALDIPLVRINATDDGNADRLKQFTLRTGILSSALEHAVPEQMFTNEQNPGEAISAVKALQKANAQDQRIYHIKLFITVVAFKQRLIATAVLCQRGVPICSFGYNDHSLSLFLVTAYCIARARACAIASACVNLISKIENSYNK